VNAAHFADFALLFIPMNALSRYLRRKISIDWQVYIYIVEAHEGAYTANPAAASTLCWRPCRR
jgi:hypothetical protein